MTRAFSGQGVRLIQEPLKDADGHALHQVNDHWINAAKAISLLNLNAPHLAQRLLMSDHATFKLPKNCCA